MKDPAVSQAEQLWKQKQPKEAMLVLVRRINELNQTLALKDGQTAQTTPRRSRGALKIAAALLVVIVLVVVGFYIFYKAEDEGIAANLQLSAFCISDARQRPQVCDTWKQRVNDHYRSQAESCAREYPNAATMSYAFGQCLAGKGVPMPGQ